MRIRGAKTELEEAGLETDGMVESTAKLREEILALSGVDIMLNENEFKSTYKIIEELAAKWEDLSDIQQASITELIAGKRQGNIVSSLMSNFDIAEKALETSLNSSGSAMREHEKWQQSLEARINKVKAAWQSLSQSFLSSNFLKTTLDGVIALVNGLNALIKTFGTLPTLLSVFVGGRFLMSGKGFATFDKQTKSIQLFGQSISNLGTKYAEVNTKITKYNALSAKSQETLRQRWANSNTTFGKYISGLKGGKASMAGYAASLAGATLKTFALQAATMALNMAMTMGIAAAVQAVITLFDKLIVTSSELAEKVEEVTAKFEEEHAALMKLKGDYDTTNESSMISKYEKLSRGVDSLGRNVSLTADEYSEYQSIVNSIAEQIPSLVSGYDEQGNAILSCKGNIEALTEAYEKLIHIQNQEILTNAGDIEKNFANTVKDANGQTLWGRFREYASNTMNASSYLNPVTALFKLTDDVADLTAGNKMTTDTAKALKDLLNTDRSKIGDVIAGYDEQTLSEIQTALKNAGVDVGFLGKDTAKALEETLKNDSAKIKGIVDDFYGDLEEKITEQKTIATAKLSEAFDVSNAISGLNYGNIGEDLQAVAYQVVNSFDYDFLSKLSESGKSVEQWVTEMLNQLNAISKTDNAEIEAGFELQTQFNGGEISYGEYVRNLRDLESVIDNLSVKDEVKEQLKISLGLDEDGIIDQYNALVKRLTDPKNYDFDITENEARKLLDGLSAEELSIAVDVITEMSNNNVSETIDQVRNAIERELAIRGLTLDLTIEVETAKLEALTTAITESFSGSGLSSESLNAVEGMFEDLSSYDPSKLFERTANGITLNTTELRRLNSEYKKTNIAKVNKELDSLGDIYNQTREELYRLTYGTDEYNAKAAELSNIEAQIKATEQLASQYEGLASAYQEWQMVESAGSQRDMYEGIIEGFENIDDEIKRGWYDDGTVEFLELLTGKDLSTAGIDKIKEAYKGLKGTIDHTTYSVRDFFTVDEDGNSTNDGVYNFLDAIGQLEEEKFGGKDVVKRDKNGTPIAFDFQIAGGDKAIADALGISEELVQIMVRAADDAGFVVSMDGTYQQLDILKEKAQNAANELKNTLKVTEYEFDLNTGDEGSVLAQYDEALKIWEKFKKNKTSDGTVDMSVEGAEEAFTLVSTLQSMVDKLSEPVYMDIDASQVEKDMQTPLGKLQEYERLVQSEHQLELKGTDTSKIEEDKDKIIDYFENLDPEIQAELGLKNLTRDEIEKKLEAGEIEIPATVDLQVEMNNTMRDMVNVALYNAGIIDKEELETRVDVTLYANEVDASEVVNDIDSVLEESDLSEEKKVTIKAFAEVFGVDNIDDLSERLDKLDDEQIQVVANVIGRINIDALKTAIDGIEDEKKVEAIATAIGKGDVDDLKTAVNNLEGKDVEAIAKAFGYDDVESLKGAINNLTDKDVQAIATALGITDVDSLKGAIDRLTDKDVKAVANVEGKDDVNSLQSSIDGLKGKTVTIWAQVKKIASNLWGKITGSDEGGSGANGTANVNGTAFRQGSWGTKNSGTALVGELGRETLVRNGKYYTIGDNGAEFIKYQKGDIIFNHKQTEELFKNGRVTSGGGRAKALVGGTAFVEGTAFRDGSTGSGGAGRSGKGNAVTGKSYGKSSDSDEFEETIDWIETAISRIERAIDQLDTKANSIYSTWSERNKNLVSEISKVEDEIVLQQKAYDEYIRAANAVGLSSSYASKVRNGTIDIETITDEVLKEKIDDYQTWYEKALACQDAILELKETESELYKQRFDNVASQYEGILGVIEHEKNMLEEYISQSEANAQLISAHYYNALASNEKENLDQLKKEKVAMLAELQTAMESGTIARESESWYELVNSIDEVTLAIAESETQLKEYSQTIQQLSWETFDLLQEKISAVTEETEFLIDLMSSDKLFDDNGRLTDSGIATMGQHGVAYNAYMYQADLVAKEAEKLKKQLTDDPYDTELEERYREMISLQQEYILSAQDEKEAIRDLVEEGIELELDALQELIDKKNEELESAKDLYDYQKKVKEQTEEIASLEKQMAAYSGDDSEEARQKIQQIKVDLESAKEDLAETEYDKLIEDSAALLDELYLEYETLLNARLDNLDALVSDMITEINASATSISATLSEKADSVGYTLSDSMKTIWDDNTVSTTNVIADYGTKFLTAATTTNNALSTINTNLQNMIAQLNKLAKTNVKSASISSAANSKQANATKKSTTTTNTKPTTTTSTTNAITVGGKINASGAKIYDYAGDTSGERQLYRNDPIYKVLKTDGNWLQVRWHKLSSGITGWFKKGDVKAYATGKKNFLDDEIAWTQDGGQEFIVRPSDGAILTPIAKGDSILTTAASSNIWNMANNPAEFIKDNLKLDTSNVPNNSTVQNSYTQHLDNVVFSFPNVKNYDDMLSAMQKDKSFEKLIMAMTIDRIAGGSSLAKNKSIR